jgi:hypothetical protein
MFHDTDRTPRFDFERHRHLVGCFQDRRLNRKACLQLPSPRGLFDLLGDADLNRGVDFTTHPPLGGPDRFLDVVQAGYAHCGHAVVELSINLNARTTHQTLLAGSGKSLPSYLWSAADPLLPETLHRHLDLFPDLSSELLHPDVRRPDIHQHGRSIDKLVQ